MMSTLGAPKRSNVGTMGASSSRRVRGSKGPRSAGPLMTLASSPVPQSIAASHRGIGCHVLVSVEKCIYKDCIGNQHATTYDILSLDYSTAATARNAVHEARYQPLQLARESRLEDLEGECDSLPASNTHSHHAALETVPGHGMKQARGQHRSGGANRVTVSDSAAFDIHDVLGKTEFARHGERDRCEGFVDLDTVQMRQLPACTFQRLMNGGHRAQAEHAGIDGAQSIGHQPGHRPQSMSFGMGALGHHHRGGAAVESGRVSGCDGAVRAEGRAQFCEGRQSGIRTRMLVACEYRRAFLACNLDRDNFALELPGQL